MNKKNGFTLVELLVVIAILAVLATVALLGYRSFVDKAKVSNDSAVVTELNHYLSAANATNDPINTTHDARNLVLNSGFDIYKNLQPSKSDYKYAYNLSLKKFVLVDENWEASETSDRTYDAFVLVNSDALKTEAENHGYSVYLQENYKEAEVVTKYGIDLGNHNDITKVTYTNNTNTPQEVTILIYDEINKI